MASETLAGGLRGLAEGSSVFGRTLQNLSGTQMRREQRALQNRRAEERLEMQRQRLGMSRDRLKAQQFAAGLRAATTPGVNTSGEGQPIGEIAGQRYFRQEPEPETPEVRFNQGGIQTTFPRTEEGLQSLQNFSSTIQPLLPQTGGSGGLTLRGAKSPYDPVKEPEKYRAWVQSTEGPIQQARGRGEERPTPTFGQAMERVNEMYQTGTEFDPTTGEPQPTFRLGAGRRAAKADSLATGELTIPELAKRLEGGTPAPESRGGEEQGAAREAPPADAAAADTTSAEGRAGEQPGNFLRRIVAAARDRGLEDDEIRRRLKRSGYSNQEIETVLEE